MKDTMAETTFLKDVALEYAQALSKTIMAHAAIDQQKLPEFLKICKVKLKLVKYTSVL